jgi:hypothetical protein
MSESYIVRVKKKITRKEGNSGRIRFIMPVTFSMIGKDVLFQVRDERDRLILDKSTDDGITITDQTIEIELLSTDLVGNVGNHEWEMLISEGDDYDTLGEGCFVVTKRRARYE